MNFRSKDFRVKKNLGQNKFWVMKILSLKYFWIKKNLCSKIFHVKKWCLPKNCCAQKNLSHINFVFEKLCVQKLSGPRNFGSKDKFGLKIFGAKKIWVQNKILGQKKFWVQKIWCSKKLLGPKQFLVKKNVRSKKVLDPKNFGSKIFSSKKFWSNFFLFTFYLLFSPAGWAIAVYSSSPPDKKRSNLSQLLSWIWG